MALSLVVWSRGLRRRPVQVELAAEDIAQARDLLRRQLLVRRPRRAHGQAVQGDGSFRVGGEQRPAPPQALAEYVAVSAAASEQGERAIELAAAAGLQERPHDARSEI